MYNIIVCDDNKVITEVMVILLKKYVNLYDAEVMGFTTGHEVLEHCSDNKCDLIYMDIEIGSENGMAVAKTLKKMNPQMLIIYISAYNHYYVEMVQAEPFRFISKEMTNMEKFEREVADTLEAAMRRIQGKDLWKFEFNRKQYIVELGKIRYFHSFLRKIYIVGKIGDVPEYYYGNMDDLQEELKCIDENFVRISKSYIVNMRYVRYAGINKVRVGDAVLTVTAKYYKEFKEKHMKYWVIDYK